MPRTPYIPTFLIAAGILYASLTTHPIAPMPEIRFADKWGHLLAYACLSAVFLWDLTRAYVPRGWKYGLAFVLPIVYGGVIEILQERYCAPRTGDWYDWLADILGTILGIIILLPILRFTRHD